MADTHRPHAPTPSSPLCQSSTPMTYPSSGSFNARLAFASALMRAFASDPDNTEDYITPAEMTMLRLDVQGQGLSDELRSCLEPYRKRTSLRNGVLFYNEHPLLGLNEIPNALASLKVAPNQSLGAFQSNAKGRYHGLSKKLLARWYHAQVDGVALGDSSDKENLDAYGIAQGTYPTKSAETLQRHSSLKIGRQPKILAPVLRPRSNTDVSRIPQHVPALAKQSVPPMASPPKTTTIKKDDDLNRSKSLRSQQVIAQSKPSHGSPHPQTPVSTTPGSHSPCSSSSLYRNSDLLPSGLSSSSSKAASHKRKLDQMESQSPAPPVDGIQEDAHIPLPLRADHDDHCSKRRLVLDSTSVDLDNILLTCEASVRVMETMPPRLWRIQT